MEYKLKTKDTLKCSACGNTEFKEKKMSMGEHECHCYLCDECGHMMAFASKLEKK